MNKFDALKQFQGWPPEWQRLCAEYWIEAGEVESTQAPRTFGDKMRTEGDLRYRGAMSSDCIDQGEMKIQPMPKAAKVAGPRKLRARTRYTLQELDFLDNLIHSGLGPTLAVKNFCKRFPNSGHPKESLKTKFHKRKKELVKRGEL
jgi:hypothetical protein